MDEHPARPSSPGGGVHISTWVAILVPALVGIVSAAAAAFAPVVLQHQQDRRDDRREAVEARGAARLLYTELLQASVETDVLGHDRILRRFDRSFAIEMRAGDMRLIATHLDGEQWGAVADAVASVQGVQTFVNTLVERGRKRLTKGEVCYLRWDVRTMFFASKAIAPLAAAPGNPPVPPDPTCSPKPGPVRGAAESP